jgi:nucleoid DNA-binding protein
MSIKKVLSKIDIVNTVVEKNTNIPPQVTRLATEMIFNTIFDTLCEGKIISIRGFGRLIPRKYKNTKTKKQYGLIFHPSPHLISMVNQNAKKMSKISNQSSIDTLKDTSKSEENKE